MSKRGNKLTELICVSRVRVVFERKRGECRDEFCDSVRLQKNEEINLHEGQRREKCHHF